jgi:hypothetical protein
VDAEGRGLLFYRDETLASLAQAALEQAQAA